MNKAVFLDRDGTINVDKDYLYRIEDFEYIDGAVEGMKALQDMGYLLVIVTNQSGIARGYYSEDDYLQLEHWLLADLKAKGVNISGAYYCPHHPKAKLKEYRRDCDCRKPKTGLFYRAVSDLEIDLDDSIAIGDKPRDLAICKETKAMGILLTKQERPMPERQYCCRDWREIVEFTRKERMG